MTHALVSRRIEDARVEREYREYVESFAAIHHYLGRLAQHDGEEMYDAVYDCAMTPTIVNCKRAIGPDLFAAAMREAIELSAFVRWSKHAH